MFGDLLVATLRLSSGNKCHFHYYSHPHGKLLKETNFEKSIIICTDTTAVNCCALEKGCGGGGGQRSISHKIMHEHADVRGVMQGACRKILFT